MYNTLKFLNDHNILSDNPHGFRKYQSKAHARTCSHDKNASAI